MRTSALRSHAAEHTAPHLRRNTWQRLNFGMNALDEVPFQTVLGPLEVEVQLVTAPVVNVPDSHQILQDTEYGFNLEKLVLCGQQPLRQAPSCPPFWLMFSSPQEGRRSGCSCGDMWAPCPRSRSHSLNSADARRLHHRTVKFLISDSEDDDGCYEDNEGSSTEDVPHPIKERPRGPAPIDPASRVKELHLGSSTHRSKTDSPRGLRRLSPSRQGGRPPLRALEQHRSQPASPLLLGKKSSKKRQRSVGCLGRRFSQNTPPAALSPCRPQQQQQQQRPSSAGPVVKNRRQALSTGGSCGVFFDSAAELLSALSQEERELLETITERGYPLRTAILALQKTGYHNPEKILKYLRSRDRLCELGYDEAQVEEALEMFQNCESKAAEFLRLVAQFNEMGFQQSAIKEVLLVHENHRERALEELMTRMA